MKINSLKKQKHEYPIHTWWYEGSKGTVVNLTLQSLHAGSLEITLTVPSDAIQKRCLKLNYLDSILNI